MSLLEKMSARARVAAFCRERREEERAAGQVRRCAQVERRIGNSCRARSASARASRTQETVSREQDTSHAGHGSTVPYVSKSRFEKQPFGNRRKIPHIGKSLWSLASTPGGTVAERDTSRYAGKLCTMRERGRRSVNSQVDGRRRWEL